MRFLSLSALLINGLWVLNRMNTPAPIQGLFGLLCLLPEAIGQSSDHSWVSIQGEESHNFYINDISINAEDYSFLSGYENITESTSAGLVAVLNSEGELQSSIKISAGTSIKFKANSIHNEEIWSVGSITKNQTNGFLARTRANGTLSEAYELKGLTGSSAISEILKTPQNTSVYLVEEGSNLLLIEADANNIIKKTFKYNVFSSIRSSSIVKTNNSEFIISASIEVDPIATILFKIKMNGEAIWAKYANSISNGDFEITSLNEKNGLIYASGNFQEGGVIVVINSQTGATLSVTKTWNSSSLFTTKFNDLVVTDDNKMYLGGQIYQNTSESFPDALALLIDGNKTSIVRVGAAQKDQFNSVALNSNGKPVFAGQTASNNANVGNLNPFTMKLGYSLEHDEDTLPLGLIYHNATEIILSETGINDFLFFLNAINITGLSFTKVDVNTTINSLENLWPYAPTGQPSSAPSAQPVSAPTTQPSSQPSGVPSAQPAATPTTQPSSAPSAQPVSAPTTQPSSSPSSQPSSQPSGAPSAQPAATPTTQPSSAPSAQPISDPTTQPSLSPSSQPSSQPSRVPSAQPTTQPSKQPNAHPSVSPTPHPSISFAPTVSTPSNWTAQINSKSFFSGYGAYKLAIVNKQTIVCGGILPGVCFKLSRINGALLSSYSMPWDITNAMTGVGDSVAVLGQGNGKPPYTIAMFNPKSGTFPWISTTSSQYARWQAIDYDSITQQLVAVGFNDNKNAVFALVHPETGALTAKQYSMPSANLYMNEVVIFPFHAGFCMSGYTIEADYSSSMILILVDSSGKLTAVNKLNRADMPISAQWNEISRVAVIDKTNPAVKDVVVVGKTQEPDATTKGFISFVHNGMFPTINSFKLNMGQSSQFTHVIIEDNIAVVTGSFIDTNKQEYAIFLSVDITTGMPLLVKGISSPGRSHCYSIIATEYGYEASCSMNDQITVFALDSNFDSGILPPEYAQIDLMQAINQPLESFNLLISSVPLSTIPAATVLPNEAFTLQTHEKATWVSLEQLWPENLPTSAPSQAPTNKPTVYPTPIFTSKPTLEPSYAPIPHPTANPTMTPSTHPSATPTNPTSVPSSSTPTLTYRPSRHPSYKPSQQPTDTPSFEPTRRPIIMPTHRPEVAPTNVPTNKQTPVPTLKPSGKPHVTPSPTKSTERPSSQAVVPSKKPTFPPMQTPAQQQEKEAKKKLFILSIVLGTIAFAGIIGRMIWKNIHHIQRFFNRRVAPQETTPNTLESMPVHAEEHDADLDSSSHSINYYLSSSSEVSSEDTEDELEPWDIENNILSNSSSSLSSDSLPSVSSEDIDEDSEPGDIENLKRPF